ncbi:inactive receptor-like serine/threonine-protein kinase [Carex littledalei]|uniref:Inactive receptor-like serine/threonine-protein kinase n=1 Tax=Carex littledalei TaxID=544730 RepID=A0A833QXG1_9POAL|nr:inactive receptor-like serine/threonine-protein kinase [Carex littledalei]
MGILGGRLVGLLLLVFLVFERFQLGASFISEGSHLLRFREGIEHDPYGALSNWGENGSMDYCSWFGVACSDDFKVVALNLPDLALNGIISPKIGKLNHLRIVDLSNNSFYGVIPREIGELKQLVVLDLRNNSLSGTLPSKLDNILSLKLLLINGNMISGELSPKLQELSVISEVIEQDDFEMSEKRYSKNGIIKRQLQSLTARKALESPPPSPDPSPDPSPSSSPLELSPPVSPPSNRKSHTSLILGLAIGGVFIIGVSLALYMFLFKGKRVNIVPWKTGLSGPISKALIAGVPSLGRADLDAACENFSNIIATSSDHTIYKGTLSNGSEIAVVSTSMSADKWMDLSENQFKLKISTLSKINHKNFMNLLGFCNDDDPFTRMLVVEYAPNGTLFEHLHIKEAEQLDWSARLRIAMGIIYCLEYIESINPPARVKTLNSYTIYLSEDYAAKISDIGFGVDTKKDPFVTDDPNDLDEEEPIVYKYAVLLLELISGKLPFSADTGLLVLWASSYLSGKRSLMEMVDPTLDDSISEEFLMALCEVIRACINPNTEERPSVAEVAKQMKEISRLSPEAAIPRDSPLWWAELEIFSTEGS